MRERERRREDSQNYPALERLSPKTNSIIDWWCGIVVGYWIRGSQSSIRTGLRESCLDGTAVCSTDVAVFISYSSVDNLGVF